MFKRVIFIIGAMLLFSGQFHALAVEPQIKIVTGNIPPYSIESLETKGFMYEIVDEIEKRLGTNRPVKFYPWPRAQLVTVNRDDHIIFPLTRIKQREDKYDWLIPVTTLDLVFATIGKEISSLDHAKEQGTIIVRQYTPLEAFLKQEGFENYETSLRIESTNLNLLLNARVDAWFGSKHIIQYYVKSHENGDQVKISKPFSSRPLYIAASKGLSPVVIEKYRDTYKQMLADGIVAEILSKYK